MALHLHNPASQAHLQDLRERLASHFACSYRGGYGEGMGDDQIETLLAVVRGMDTGAMTPKEAIETFARHGFPSFSKWLMDTLDEGVYLDSCFGRAA